MKNHAMLLGACVAETRNEKPGIAHDLTQAAKETTQHRCKIQRIYILVHLSQQRRRGTLPYSISPLANALCIRSSVTISRTTFHQMNGLSLKMTYHGLSTPTQMDCLHEGSVCSHQSSQALPSTCPVPSNNRTNSSLEMKNGCAHSSYKN